MKSSTLLIFLFSFFNLFAQEESKTIDKHFGVAINSSLMRLPESISIAPTGFFYVNKHQIELGFAFHPVTLDNGRNLGAELNYKYFPDGIDKIFNLYFVTNLAYTNQHWEDSGVHFQSGIPFRHAKSANFITLTGGYGVQVKFFKNAYLGTNFTLGVTTCSENVESTGGTDSNYSRSMFGEYYLDGSVRLNIGYRF